MKRILFLILITLCSCASPNYDVIIYGASSAGVVAGYSAAQQGLKVLILEPSNHIGGLTTGGLGFTDIGNKQVVKGVAKQFYRRLGEHYGQLEQWIFEPSVAEEIMRNYLNHKNIKLITNARLSNLSKDGTRINSVCLEDGSEFKSKYFIDASYEGDLMALAGVSYTVGREPNSQYGETYNGVQLMTGHQFPDGVDPYIIPGDKSSGLLWGISNQSLLEDGSGDNLVQAYNYRICLSKDPSNSIPITKPSDYDPSKYELLLRLIAAQPTKRALNDYFIVSQMPNNKTDINNRGGFSSDMIGMNYSYPEANYNQRDSILEAHISYTKGLLYFIGNDPRVPEELRNDMLQYGYPNDEYVNTNHWTPQLYVREARRMIGEYVATQADCQGFRVPEDGVAMAAYTMDSHNCQRIVITKDGKDMVKNEGNVEIGGGLPYPISYGSITPKRSECTNLLVPVCLSASHIAFGSIRMEPVFMVLGQVSAVAIAKALEAGNIDIQLVDSREINLSIDENPYMDGSVPDILIDDLSHNVSVSDKWFRRNVAGGYGTSFYELKKTDSIQTASFNADINYSGKYKVYIYQSVSPILSKTINVSVKSGSEVYPLSIVRSEIQISGQTNSTWVELGEFYFTKDSDASVIFDNSSADAPIRADAVLFVKQ